MNMSLDHWDIGLALMFLCRFLVLYRSMVKVAESAQVATLLAVEGPSSIARLPDIGEVPTHDNIKTADVRLQEYADASWWSMQVRAIMSQYALGSSLCS